MAEMAALYGAAIDTNNVYMDRACKHMMIAMRWGIAGLVIGGIALLFIFSAPLTIV
jgi:hypothetical protein